MHHRVGTSVSGAPEACKFYERNDELAVNRWALEVAIHKTLSGDPHIVKYYGAYFCELSLLGPARCNIVMELCRQSLHDFISFYCQVEFEDVQAWVKDNHSVLHRDMKAANCLLQHVSGARTSVKICDFGNSVFLIGPGRKDFPSSLPLAPLMTTYRYASPEIVSKRPYGFSCDIWAVGVILWEMLQEDARVPAVDFDQETRTLGDLELEDSDVRPQRQVVAYFVTGRKAYKQGEAGSLWAYEDSFMKVSSTVMFVPNGVKEVSILPE